MNDHTSFVYLGCALMLVSAGVSLGLLAWVLGVPG